MTINQQQQGGQPQAVTKLVGTSTVERQQWIDVARGIGIFLVVLGHVNRGLITSRIVPASDFFIATDHTIYTFHMPLFFFLSGMTMRLQIHKPPHVIFSRMLLIVYAYFVWSILQLLLQFYFSDYVNRPASLSDFVGILYAPIGQFWFLYALLICHLIYLATLGRTILIVAALVVFGSIQIFDLGIISVTSHFFVFYAAGLLLTMQTLSLRASVALLGALTALFTVAVTLNWTRGVYYGSFEALPAACLGIAAVVVASKLITGPAASMLALMGRLSLPIFLAHAIAGSGVRIAMIHLGVPHDATLYIVCGVTAGIALPMLFYWVLARLHVLPLFGFAPFENYCKRGPTDPITRPKIYS